MCIACWEQYGSPRLTDGRVLDAAKAIRAVYDVAPTGGGLHCELDDWNIDDEFFEDERHERRHGDSDAQYEIEAVCYAAMKRLSLAERASALAIFDGFFEP